MKKTFLTLVLVLCAAETMAALPALNASYQKATASTASDKLSISTGTLSAQWKTTKRGLALIELKDDSGKTWRFNSRAVSDWHIPGVTEGPAVLKSLSAREHDDEGFTHRHLQVNAEFHYPQTHASAQYRIWAYPNAAGLRTQLWLKAEPGFQTPSEQPPGTVLRLPIDTSSFTRRAAIYSKYNSARAERYEQFPMMREEQNQGPITTTETYNKAALLTLAGSAGSLILVKEAPVVDSPVRLDERFRDRAWQPYRTGGFEVSTQTVLVTGAGIAAADLKQDQWLPGWATWIVLAEPGDDAVQQTLKRYDRRRFPFVWERDWYIGANNWGSTSTPRQALISSQEPSILLEIAAAGEMGIEMIQIDDGWQKGRNTFEASRIDPQAYPEGWKNVVALARQHDVKLGLWMGWPQEVSISQLIQELKAGEFTAVKLDFYNTSTYEKAKHLRDIARKIHADIEWPFVINWDITGVQSKDQGFFYNREYGNLWLENQKQHLPDHTLYRPWRVLRDAWELAHYVNLDQVQIAIQNPNREYEGGSDAPEHSQSYCTAIGLMGSPNFFQELKYLEPEARQEIKTLLDIYKDVRPDMAQGIVYPIGKRPDNSQWTGFQNYNENTGTSYLLVFRERLNQDSTTKLPLRFYQPGTQLELTDLRTGKKKTLLLDENSQAELTIANSADFLFLKLTTPGRDATAPPKSRPNIVFFLVDDLGWADVGYNGATYHLTPNIDKFSEQALVFDRAYTMPTCSPSRASLFTGLNAPHTGIYHVRAFNVTPPKYFKVKPVTSGHFYKKPITMLGDVLQRAGYATGYVGKWHVDHDPTQHGFTFNAGGWGQGGPKSYFSPYKNPALKDGPKGEYLSHRLLEESQSFIQQNKEKPFFLCYAPYLVHRPLQARAEDIAKFKERKPEEARHDPIYAAMVEATDHVFQSVLDTLAAEGLTDNTIIIFTSDNGMNGLVGDSTPLRGEKGSCYEGGVRVPTMVYWPGVTPARHTDALFDVIDWYPTVVEMTGVTPPEHRLDGISQVPVLTGSVNSVRDAVYCHMPCYNGRPNSPQIWQTPFSSVCTGKYKLIHFYEDQSVELYDLEADISENNNLATIHPDIANSLKHSLDNWLTKNKAERPIHQINR